MTTSLKTCFKCKKEKELIDFYKHSAMSDGYLGKCKECAKADVKNNRAANIDNVRSYDRSRSSLPHRLEKNREVTTKWRKKYPERKKAQSLLRSALKSGKIKPLLCFICGGNAEAHHPDYNQPLDVVWLCPSHHKQAHAMARTLTKRTTV